MKHTVLRYGLISGIILVAFGWLNFFITKPIGYTASEVGGYLSILLGCGVAYLGIKYHRDHKCGGYISFKRGFTVGVLIILITSAFMFLSTVAFFGIMGEEWLEWAMENMSPERKARFEVQLSNPLMMNPAIQGIVMALTVFVIGAVISAISAAILQKRPQSA